MSENTFTAEALQAMQEAMQAQIEELQKEIKAHKKRMDAICAIVRKYEENRWERLSDIADAVRNLEWSYGEDCFGCGLVEIFGVKEIADAIYPEDEN